MDRFKRAGLAVMVALAVFWSPPPAGAQPDATQVITAVPVGLGGEPINGYREAASQGNVTAVSDCTTSSPSAVADNIYYCSPSAAGAGTCWPSTADSLLCMTDPWDKQLHRVTYTGPLPHVQPPAVTDPFALLLDDGTRCFLRNGGAWGGRDDGYVGVYGCDGAGVEPCRPMAAERRSRFVHQPIGPGVDGQSRSTRFTRRELPAAAEPGGVHRVVRWQRQAGLTHRLRPQI